MFKKGGVVWVIVFAVLFIAGCAGKSGDRLAELEKKMTLAESRLDSCEQRIDYCENDLYSMNQRQTAVEECYKELSETRGAAKAESVSLTNEEIQKALKNAGFYNGNIDGKIGPNTEKAVKDFQAANGLKADGVVGSKTKSLLSKYLKQQ